MTTATATPSLEQRFVIWDADWETYENILEALGDRPVRLTYDRGKLELMTVSLGHEHRHQQ